MKQKILKLFSKIQNKIFQKRKLLVMLLPIILATVIFYPEKAYAIGPILALVIGSAIAGIVTPIVAGLTAGLTFITLIGGIQAMAWAFGHFFMLTAIGVLNWAIRGGPFSSWSMTNPANNPIIQIGWTLLRDLTNMFFILGLAYIGLATALNFASFNTKKTFTTLIIVALLINFTPVICGLIVDGTNIISNFFLSEVNFNSMADIYINTANNAPPVTKENLTAFESVSKFLLMQTYSFFAGCVLLTFSAIFLLRTFIIWFLVILSPFAFFCRIFDFSKKWFTKWWSMFVGWAFVAIPAAFFLYLSNHLLVITKSGTIITWSNRGNFLSTILSFIFPTVFAANAAGTTADLGFWGNLTPYLVATAFLIVGLVTTLKIKTAGTGFIMNIANKAARLPQSASKWVGGTAGKAIGDIASKDIKLKYADKGLRGMDERLKSGKKVSWLQRKSASILREQQEKATEKVPGEKSSYEKRAEFKENSFTSMAEKAKFVANMASVGDVSDHYNLEEEKDRDTMEDVMEYAFLYNPEQLKKISKISWMDTYKDKVDVNGNIIYKKDKYGNDMFDRQENQIAEQEIDKKSILKKVYERNKDKVSDSFLKRMGLWVEQGDKDKYNSKEAQLAGLADTTDDMEIIKRRMIDKLKTSDMPSTSKPDLMAMLDSDEFQFFGNQAQIAKAAELFPTETVKHLQGVIDKKPKDYYYNHNKRLHNYYKNTPASILGFEYDYKPPESGGNNKQEAGKQVDQVVEVFNKHQVVYSYRMYRKAEDNLKEE